MIWFTPNEAREEPYLGQCAEFCGLSHALMKFRVFVQTQADFDAWAHAQLAIPEEPTDELLAQGLAIASSPVFTTRDGQSVVGCAACHTIAGTALGGRVGPDLTHVGSRSTIAAGVLENTPENMVRWISNPSKVKPGAEPPRSMPAFEDVLTDEQLQALVAYLQSLE
jgi:cytochrome c oxidase subunit 2